MEPGTSSAERLRLEFRDLQERLQHTEQLLRTAAETAASWEQAARASEERHQERCNELLILTCLLERQEQKSEELKTHSAWIAAVLTSFQKRPRWWQFMTAERRRALDRRLLKRAGLFDHDAYLRRYPDVAEAGMEALDHYLHHGLHEGRSRSLAD